MLFKTGLKRKGHSAGTEELITSVVDPDLCFFFAAVRTRPRFFMTKIYMYYRKKC
jgi:hypothetical protein